MTGLPSVTENACLPTNNRFDLLHAHSLTDNGTRDLGSKSERSASRLFRGRPLVARIPFLDHVLRARIGITISLCEIQWLFTICRFGRDPLGSLG